MKVILTRKAFADLDDIADWIGRDDWDRAETFVESLRRRCASLSRHPRRYPTVPRPSGVEMRKLAYRGYLIFYLVLEKEVDILRIVHGARDWAALLGEGD
jgi:toxin ParE1/3/4